MSLMTFPIEDMDQPSIVVWLQPLLLSDSISQVLLMANVASTRSDQTSLDVQVDRLGACAIRHLFVYGTTEETVKKKNAVMVLYCHDPDHYTCSRYREWFMAYNYAPFFFPLSP